MRCIFPLLVVLALFLVACEGLEPPAAPREPAIEEEPVLDTLAPEESEAEDMGAGDVDEPIPEADEPAPELEEPMATAEAIEEPTPAAAATEQIPTLVEVNPSAIQAPEGFQVEVVAQGLNYVGDVTLDPNGEIYVAEVGGHTYGTGPEAAPQARILQIMPDSEPRVVYDEVVPLDIIRSFGSTAEMPEGIIPPITGLTLNPDNGLLYVSHRGRYSMLDPETGEFETIINGLPVWGEFLNHKPIFGPDGMMYFVLSTQGNSGTVDEHMMRVMRAFNKPFAHEIPCEDVTLTGLNFQMDNMLTEEADDQITVGVYVPAGVETEPGQVVEGEFWCHGAVYRTNPDGTEPARIAWGLRSVFGLDFSENGRLVVTNNSGNIMEPRPIYDDWETLYEIEEGGWYGWPDYYSGLPVTDERFTRPNEPDFQGEPFPHEFSLAEETRRRLAGDDLEPIQPLVRLPVHAAAEGMVFGKAEWDMDPENEVLVAEFGAIIPYYKEPTEWPGFRVQKVNLETGEMTDFLVNSSQKPAWVDNSGGLRRPLQLAWGPDGALYVADFGVIRFDEEGMTAEPGTGVIWKVTRTEEATAAVSTDEAEASATATPTPEAAGEEPFATPTRQASGQPQPLPADYAVGAELVVEGFTSPLALVPAPDDSGRLFVVDQIGLIHIIDGEGNLRDEPFLDIQDRLVALREDYDERGLLGLAFHPNYSENGRFFVYYSAPLRPEAPDSFNNTSHLSEFRVSDDENKADADSETLLMQIDQPQSNHAGGTVLFGPDGYLYLSLGDGGGANDSDLGHVEDWYEANAGGNGQDVTDNLLGSILRIDVDNGDPYAIPADNPLADGEEGLPEIYAYGFRNPYRISFDAEGGRLFAADAGQELWEEVSIVEAGGNYGWNIKEGTHCFNAADPSQPPETCPRKDPAGNPLIDPVIEFQSASAPGGEYGIVAVGGHVYRGGALPELTGHYVFGAWSMSHEEPDGTLLAATPQGAGLWAVQEIEVAGYPDERLHQFILGFGQDNGGELYVLADDTPGPTGNTGKVFRLVPPE